MFFHIEHTTEYLYSEPATESFSELRLKPRDSVRQKVSRYLTRVEPAVLTESYTDYFGNFVETVSVPFRHHKLVVRSRCDIQTSSQPASLDSMDITLSEARQLYSELRRELYDFVRPSHFIPMTRSLHTMASELLPVAESLSTSLLRLNEHIFSHYKYTPGSTDATTTVAQFVYQKNGVCQDFAHLMIALCRNAGIPARYVSGYIETDPIPGAVGAETALVGATASHAWVEVFAPNRVWVGFDPTNNILEGERHVQIALGRDYHDVPPLKGVFKGPQQQVLSVQVRVTRNEVTPEPDNPTLTS